MPAAPGSHPSTAERTASPALKLEAEGLCLRLLRYLRVDVAPSTRLLLVSRNNGGTFGRMRTTEYTGRTCPLLVRTGLVAAFLAAGVVAGEQSACADAIVRCWGYNYYGQCDTPVDLGPCSSVAGGLSTPSHSEAMAASGAGDSTTTASATRPRILVHAQASRGAPPTPLHSKSMAVSGVGEPTSGVNATRPRISLRAPASRGATPTPSHSKRHARSAHRV